MNELNWLHNIEVSSDLLLSQRKLLTATKLRYFNTEIYHLRPPHWSRGQSVTNHEVAGSIPGNYTILNVV